MKFKNSISPEKGKTASRSAKQLKEDVNDEDFDVDDFENLLRIIDKLDKDSKEDFDGDDLDNLQRIIDKLDKDPKSSGKKKNSKKE